MKSFLVKAGVLPSLIQDLPTDKPKKLSKKKKEAKK